MNLTEIRQNYPQYNDLSDEDLTRTLHSRYYPDLSFDDFSNKIGYQPSERIPVAETPEAQMLAQAVEPEEEGHWEGWIKPTLEEIGRAGILAPAETAMALAGPVLTWPAGKLKGIATVIGSLFSAGDPEKGAEMARAAEEDVMALGYQPYTPEAQKAVELVGKAFHYGLWPARKAGEELTNMGYPRLGYLLETTGELAMFEVAHGVRAKVKARAAAKKVPPPTKGPKDKISELERFGEELEAEGLRIKEEIGELREPRVREELPPEFARELREVEPIEVAPYELLEGKLPEPTPKTILRKAWQAIEARERPEVWYKRKGKIIKEEPKKVEIKGEIEKPIEIPIREEAPPIDITKRKGVIFPEEKFKEPLKPKVRPKAKRAARTEAKRKEAVPPTPEAKEPWEMSLKELSGEKGYKVGKLPGEDIARAEADGTITLDKEKFFGHGIKERKSIIEHERAHFIEEKISPKYKAQLFDNKEVMAYRGRNINEKLANMIQDGKFPKEVLADYPELGKVEKIAPIKKVEPKKKLIEREFVTNQQWESYARRIEKANLREKGKSLSVVSIARKASEHIIEIQDDRKGMMVTKGWREAMKEEPVEKPTPPEPKVTLKDYKDERAIWRNQMIQAKLRERGFAEKPRTAGKKAQREMAAVDIAREIDKQIEQEYRQLSEKPTPPEPKVRPKAKARKPTSLAEDVADAGGLWDKSLEGEIRDITEGWYAKVGAEKFKKVPAIRKKGGKTVDEMRLQMETERGYKFRSEDDFLIQVQKDIGAIAQGKLEARVKPLTDIALEDKMWKDYLERAKEHEISEREATETLSRERQRIAEEEIAKEAEFADAERQAIQAEISDYYQETLIKKPAPFELKAQEPPPKVVGPLGKKAVFPTEAIPTPTKGRQREIFKKKPEKGTTYQMFESGGLQYGYEALKSIKEGRTEKVRQFTEQARKEFLTPIEGNPLDKGAIAFLKSEKYKDYVTQMPNIGDLKPSEIFKYDPTAKKLIATIETKEGKLKPAIRQSGYHALKDFGDAFTGVKDVSKLSPTWTDPTRFIQELDQGRWGGMAQKHILWPMRSTTLAKVRWSDMRKASLAKLQDKYNAKSGKKADAMGDVIEYISTERLRVPSKQFLQIPEVAKALKGFKPKVKIELIDGAKELRTFFNNLLKAQNVARKLRKQKLIDYRQVYRPWVMEQNIWHKLLGLKQKPETIMERPEMPDFIFPDKPPNPRALAREGGLAGYPKVRNIFRLAADYIDTAGRDIFDTNLVHHNKIHSAVLRGKGLENAAEGINRLTAEVYAGVSPRITRAAVETIPKPIHKGILKLRRMLTRAVFPLNWTWNMFIQTSSAGITYARYGSRSNLAGLKYFLDAKTKNAVQANAYSYILKSRWGGKAHYQDIQNSITRNKRLEAKPIEKVEDLFNYLTSTFENGLTGHAITAARHHGRTKLGLKGRELWEYASEGGAKTQSMYNYGDLPGFLRAKEVGAVAPFQTFSFEVFNTVREMNIPVLRKLIGKTGLYETMSADSVAGKALLSNRMKMLSRWAVAIAITDMVGEKAIGRKPWVVSSFIPFVGYIVGGYAGRGPVPHQYIQDAKRAIKDVLVNEDFGRLRKWLLRYHVLAGVQINRMLDGIEAVAKRGRVEDITGRLLYKVSPEEYLKGVLMGPARTEAGKEYIRKRREAKSLIEQLKKKKKTYPTID